ncbi:uncharacterized protein LOC141655563 [Silene latifolia]|uniref:uncharacterized protein LOC141655563 n=1 Tax=Silene latifolia TaxID=37657 RepID=UPI003D77417D
MELVKEKVEVVPVWIRLYGIPLKFWGNCLPKIAALVGKYVQQDKDTFDKVRLSYARIMVELPMDQSLPEKIKFLDENGQVMNKTKEIVAVLSPTVLTPANFPPLSAVRATPFVQSTPAKNIFRLNRQENMVGVRLSSKFGTYTFLDALNRSANPGGTVVEVVDSGKDPPKNPPNLGEFNAVLSPIGRLGGNTSDAEMQHFQDCVSICGMEDIPATGALFTCVAHFHPEGLFDHCPCTVMDRNIKLGGRKNFKYFNIWGSAPSFKNIVADVWKQSIRGTKMFVVIKKLKVLKPALKQLNKACFSDIENNTNIASIALEKLQKELVLNPGDVELMQQEMDLAKDLREMILARDSFLVQKAKVQWSLEGDLNTSYFQHAIKKRNSLNKVFQIENKEGVNCTEGHAIQNAFLEYYQGLLGSQTTTVGVNFNVVRRGNCCIEDHAVILGKPVTLEEVKQSIFSIPPGKSPGPDGHSSQFFRDAWDVIGDEVTGAILNFFETGQLLTQINSTIITLIPKIDRLALVLPDVINRSQGAFVKGRSILENIMICQDLIRMYNRGKTSLRCMFKLDLQKAYDSIEWEFIDQMLGALNFPEKFRHMIITCISTSTYTLNLNGAHFGYFRGRRGLRQGDPISPLLFCICMEYLSRVMDYAVSTWPFRFHSLCKSLKLTHLLFADDLLMFCKGDVNSIMLVLRVLSTFSATSGLRFNASKSEVVFNGVADWLKQDIVQVSGFSEGKLPFKYLGVPIQPGRLSRLDCNVLIERIVSRIRGIGAKKLSYAGRIILINAVLNTLHNYWASIFLIPKGVIKRIEAICRNFLWSGSSEYSRSPLVVWHNVCCSKKEGGLGIKEAGVWNIASVGKLVNWIYTKADRLWVLWVDHVYMKGTSWTDYHPPLDSNWNWRNICKVRDRLATSFQGAQWVASPGGYTVGGGYQWIQGSHPPCPLKQALNTRLKLFSIGLCMTDTCVLCEAHEEFVAYLFTECAYRSKIIAGIERWLCLRIDGHYSGYSKLQRKVCRMVKLACWYAIWQERNVCRLEVKLSIPEKIVAGIIQQMRVRIVQKIGSDVQLRDRDWLRMINISS